MLAAWFLVAPELEVPVYQPSSNCSAPDVLDYNICLAWPYSKSIVKTFWSLLRWGRLTHTNANLTN